MPPPATAIITPRRGFRPASTQLPNSLLDNVAWLLTLESVTRGPCDNLALNLILTRRDHHGCDGSQSTNVDDTPTNRPHGRENWSRSHEKGSELRSLNGEPVFVLRDRC